MADEVTTAGVSSDVTDSSGFDSMAADLDSMDAAPEQQETPAAPGTAPVPIEDEPAVPETPDEEPTEEEPPPAEAAEAAKEESGEELPEGVSVRERNGKKEFVLRESRYHNIYQGYKAAQSAEQVFGEELTPEVAQMRQQAYVSQEAMLADYMSGDPQAEGRFLNQLAHWSKQAQELGEVQHSPLRSIAEKLPQFLQQVGDTEALKAMTVPLMRSQIDQMYQEGKRTGNENLLLSLQHVEHALFGKYRKAEEIAQVDALAEREAKIAEREKRLHEQDTKSQQAELGRWQDSTGETIKTTVQDAITEALKPVLPFYEKFPVDLEGMREVLRNDFQATLRKDPAWQTYLNNATRRAANATSPEVRQAVAEDLKARYSAKAKYWFDSTRNTKVKEILTQRAAAMKAQSDAKHTRQATAAARREPGSIGTPVARTVVQQPNGLSTAEQWQEAIDNLR